MTAHPTIAVVGASVRATAFSLLRTGCQVVAADLFADADLQRTCAATRIADYPAGLADWLASTECDGWLYTGALENHPDLIDSMAELRPLLGNRGESLRQVRDPLVLQETLLAARLNFPETKACVGSPPGAGEWLHKTGQGGNGSGVNLFHPQSDEPPTSGYWQRRIAGTPGSAQFVGGGLYGLTRQLIGEPWIGASPFQYAGTLAPWELPSTVADDLSRVGELFATQCGLVGLFGVDFVFDGHRAWIIEVNPRATAAAEIIERTSGVNLLKEHLATFGIAIKETPHAPIPTAGKAILYAKHPLAVSRSLSDQLLTAAGSRDYPQLADIPHAGTKISPGEPILTVLAEGTDIDEVESKLRERVASLETELYRDDGGTFS
jgi:uncharacterized protein